MVYNTYNNTYNITYNNPYNSPLESALYPLKEAAVIATAGIFGTLYGVGAAVVILTTVAITSLLATIAFAAMLAASLADAVTQRSITAPAGVTGFGLVGALVGAGVAALAIMSAALMPIRYGVRSMVEAGRASDKPAWDRITMGYELINESCAKALDDVTNAMAKMSNKSSHN